jgi:hypothetical protein
MGAAWERHAMCESALRAKTYVDSKVCSRHGRNLYGNFENFTEKSKLQTVKLRKLGNKKTPASKIISTVRNLELSFL